MCKPNRPVSPVTLPLGNPAQTYDVRNWAILGLAILLA